jgi:signal transduction histidine kinase
MGTFAQRLERLLKPPLEENDEGARRVAQLLPRILLVGVLFVVGYAPLAAVLVPGDPVRLLVHHGTLVAAAVLIAVVFRRGHIRAAGVLTVALLWAHVTLSLWLHGGLETPVLGTYLIVVLLAGMLFGFRGALLSVGVCLASSLGILVAGESGLLPIVPAPTPLRIFVVFAANIGLMVGFAYLAALEVRRTHRAVEQEVAERRSAQEQLIESRARAQSFIDSSPMGIHLYRLEPDGRLVLTGANPAADRILGIDHEPLVGRLIEEAFPSLAATDVPDQYRRICREGVPWNREEVVYQDEKIRGVYQVHAFQTAPRHMATLFLDATEKRRQEEERQKLEEQLRQSQKLEAVGRLAGGVAHDFNNLLMVITAHGELLRRGLDPDDPRLRKLEQIMTAAERASLLVRQLLAFSRAQVLEPRVTDLNRLVSDVARTLRPVMGSGVRVVTRLTPEVGHVRIDRAQFEQVLMNLAVNARDAMPGGGTLELCTARREMQAGGAVPDGSYAVLAVKDSGVGMDAETRSRAFEPFFSTKSSGEGTGLGLAMVYGIVQQSGGHVTLESEPGRGSVFWIHLPRADGAGSEADVIARTAGPA